MEEPRWILMFNKFGEDLVPMDPNGRILPKDEWERIVAEVTWFYANVHEDTIRLNNLQAKQRLENPNAEIPY